MPQTEKSTLKSSTSVVIPPLPLPIIEFPEDLPVSARRDEIQSAIALHQVVIISGETGSGKTTQIPKICLAMGRGQKKIIGHTQPRRLAASSVARRIAQELKTELGQWVGYQIRFQDKSSQATAIKLMTDGILLAQTQRDPMLKRYDTIIIDEAHERSLNIDFLLGYLRQLLPKRPDLKVIITSATIDANRFATHFTDQAGRPAPIIEVTGRLYPVEIRYRPVLPLEIEGLQSQKKIINDDDNDFASSIVEAVDECIRFGAGDILVFLPGEREIRETAESLRKHHSVGTQVLPLFARLAHDEQEAIFKPTSNVRRIVLATNVAETSLTVPGIRYVIDTGVARVKRYSWRQKVEQLRLEPISQASANQRAGRCGRVGPGLCIRLYDEIDFAKRKPFSEPEILRSSLAGVILRMKSLKLDDIEQFPFVDPPTGRAIADGYQALQEIGAIHVDANRGNVMTPIGDALALLPLDPRVGRMLLAAHEQQCLTEMLVIASALAVQDPRERPLASRDEAEQAHTKFSDKKSEFLSWLNLWQWYHEQVKHKASQRKLVALLRQHYLSPNRLREWHDIHTQLHVLVGEQGWRLNPSPATYEQIHSALMSGLLGNIGLKSEESGFYQGARDIRFLIHPSSKLARRAGKWVMAGELIETTKLYARCIAQIEPVWVERVGQHMIHKTWGDPRWDRRRGQVVAHERATLYGIPIYSGRSVHFGPIDATRAREAFIMQALVPADFDVPFAFLAHNRKLIEQIEALEHRSRRPDILVDDALIFAFYDRLLPEHINQLTTFKQWFKSLNEVESKPWLLSRDDLMRHEAAGITTDVFPQTVAFRGTQLSLSYHFEPGLPRDGVTLTVPLLLLNQLQPERWDWLVPGLLKEKVQLLVRSLPQKIRKHCVPIPDYAQSFYNRYFDQLNDPKGSLIDAIATDMHNQFRVRPQANDFRVETLPAHLLMAFKVIDEHGRMLTAGRQLAQLKAELGTQAQASFQTMASESSDVQRVSQTEIIDWSFEPLPDMMEIMRKGQSVVGYPALVDQQTHCAIDVFDDPYIATVQHRKGLVRLFRIALREPIRYLEKNIPNITQLGMLYMTYGTLDDIKNQIVDVAIERACLVDPLPDGKESFDIRVAQGKSRLNLLAQEVARLTLTILENAQIASRKLVTVKSAEVLYADMHTQLVGLIHKRFINQTPYESLSHLPRYLQAMVMRIDKYKTDPTRDAKLMSEIMPLISQFQRKHQSLKGAYDAQLEQFQWQLQELRVALFAQTLRTPFPVSAKRLQKVWESFDSNR
jgi:ATP-dependent helicase HrpA